MEKQSMWRDRFTIRSYEVDVDYTIQFPVICNYLQESAWHHARNLSYGYFDLKRQNQLWVLSRIVIEIESLPVWDQTITVTTWPKGAERLFALRDFRIHDHEEKLLGTATSFWLLLDGENKRPLKLDKFLEESPILTDTHALSERYKKIEIHPEQQASYIEEVRYSDLDQNNHVNYVEYIRWCLNSHTPNFHNTHLLRRFEINFRAEALFGDRIVVSADAIDDTTDTSGSVPTYYAVSRESDGQLLCNAKGFWDSY